MAVTLNGTAATTTATAATSIAATMPSSITAGELLVAQIATSNAANTVTPPGGWTQRFQSGDGFGEQMHAVFTRVATGSEGSTQTFTFASSNAVATVFRLGGQDPTTPVNVVSSAGTATSGSTTAITTPTATTTVNNCMVLLFGSSVQVTGGIDDPASTTGIGGATTGVNSTDPTIRAAYTTLASAGATGTNNFVSHTGSGNRSWVAYTIGIAPAPDPSITVNPVATTVLDSDTAVFTVTASGTAITTYQWKKNGVNVGTNSTTLGLPAYIADNGSTITVDVTGSGGTVTSTAVILSVTTRKYPQRRKRVNEVDDRSPSGLFDTPLAGPGAFFDSFMAIPATGGTVNYTLSGAVGTYTITGRTATFKVGHTLSGAVGSYAITGRTGTLALTRRLSGAAGSYAITGNAGALHVNRFLSGAVGAYAITGRTGSFSVGHSLSGAAGSYVITGRAGTFNVGHSLPGAVGSYVINGQAGTFSYTPGGSGTVNYTLSGAAGSYAITGRTGAFNVAHVLSGAVGSYAITGRAGTFALTRNLAGASGAYAITGRTGAFQTGRNLAGATGAYVITGRAGTLTYTPGNTPVNYTLSGDSGSYLINGTDATFTYPSQQKPAGGYGDDDNDKPRKKRRLLIEIDGKTYQVTAEQLRALEKQWAEEAAAKAIAEARAATIPVRTARPIPPRIVGAPQSVIDQARNEYRKAYEAAVKRAREDDEEDISVILINL